jgi:hypothetical protein
MNFYVVIFDNILSKEECRFDAIFFQGRDPHPPLEARAGKRVAAAQAGVQGALTLGIK